MKADLATTLVCSGCGASPDPSEPYPFRCPAAREGDEIDHVLRRELSCEAALANDWCRIFLDDEPNPFVRFRSLFHSYQVATARGMSDINFVALVHELDANVAQVCAASWPDSETSGAARSAAPSPDDSAATPSLRADTAHRNAPPPAGASAGFRETPFVSQPALNAATGRSTGMLFVKDETGNVSGSHKARHMMGLAIWMEVARRTGLVDPGAATPRLAIASCGNAALAAAVVARAAAMELDVFIPPDAHPNVTRTLADLGARLTICERENDTPGDPCVSRFRESVGRGALPFSVQGNDNGLAIEGGLTLGWEIVSALLRSGNSIDRIFVQVGGGALASAVAQALRDAQALRLIERLPRLHAVQTEGAYPLRRAWERVAGRILGERLAFRIELRDASADAARASAASSAAMAARRRDAIRFAATHRSQFMQPWASVPQSVAHGILDDETYDWLAIVEAMIETGGWPVVVSESELHEANDLASVATGVAADHTGSAGLAGLVQLTRAGVVESAESLAALFTGRTR